MQGLRADLKSNGVDLLVVDATGVARRLYEASKASVLVRTMREISEVRTRTAARRVVCCFDGVNAHAARQKVHPEYKADSKVDEVFVGIMRDLYGAVTRRSDLDKWYADYWPDAEADDLIASIVRAVGPQEPRQIVIFSNDSDMHSLLKSGVVRQVSLIDGTIHWVTEESLLQEHGLTPSQWADFLVLRGGKNNLKGVPKIGKKRGIELLQMFGSLDSLIARVDEIPTKGKVQETFRAAITSGVLEQLRAVVYLRSNIAVQTRAWLIESGLLASSREASMTLDELDMFLGDLKASPPEQAKSVQDATAVLDDILQEFQNGV